MDVTLGSKAEQKAQEAESLPVFGGLNLLHIKRQVALLVSLISRDGIFDEYTRHDISHINSMLQLLEWIIPEPTQEVMSPTDWLMVVLSIYFHDVGMLVTREEFELRDTRRLHSAIGYITPNDKLQGRAEVILVAREAKLAAARETRKAKRKAS